MPPDARAALLAVLIVPPAAAACRGLVVVKVGVLTLPLLADDSPPAVVGNHRARWRPDRTDGIEKEKSADRSKVLNAKHTLTPAWRLNHGQQVA